MRYYRQDKEGRKPSSMNICLLLPRKVRKESELPLKENVLHLTKRECLPLRNPLDESTTQPVQISLPSQPSIRPFKKILQSPTSRVLTANSVPAEEDRIEYFLLPEKATSPLKKGSCRETLLHSHYSNAVCPLLCSSRTEVATC